jgi:hypothetical protein
MTAIPRDLGHTRWRTGNLDPGMRAQASEAAKRAPRRSGHKASVGSSGRGELAAALTAAVVAGLTLAPLTVLVTMLLAAAARLTRWRPQWLILPAAVGLAWTLAGSPAGAAAGFTAWPRVLIGYLAHAVGRLHGAGLPVRLSGAAPVLSSLAHALPSPGSAGRAARQRGVLA